MRLTVCSVILLICVFAVPCFAFDAIGTIKSSRVGTCPQKTIGQMVNGFILNPQWESGQAVGSPGIKRGAVLVNVKGKITFNGNIADVTLQFMFNDDLSSFTTNAMEIDGQTQSDLMRLGFLQKMCGN